MCFGTGGSKGSSSSHLASDPRALFKYWKPPEIASPSLRLNEGALDKQDARKKREGFKRFQMPLIPSQGSGGTGLNIPTKRGGDRG